MNQHAEYAPSSMHMIMACPGSHRMRRMYPEREDSPAAIEGTAAHWVAAEFAQGRWHGEGEMTPDGVTLVSTEMIEGAELWVDAINEHTVAHAHQHYETQIPCSVIAGNCWGTPDYFAHLTSVRLTVLDYKFGHRHVDAFENWQLVTYAAGVIASHKAPPCEVVLGIVQPRSYHSSGPVRVWTIHSDDLQQYSDRIAAAIEATKSPYAQCQPNPHCQDCSARHACQALQQSSLAALDVTYGSQPMELPADALSLELRMLRRASKLLEARIDGLTEQATGMSRNGQNVPGFALKAGAGRERWSKPLDEVLALGEAFGVPVAKPGAITPKQAIKAGLPAEVVSSYAETPVGELKLVESDTSTLRRVFCNNT